MKKFISILLLIFILSINVFAKEVAVIVFKQNYLSTISVSGILFTSTETAVYRITTFIESSNFAGNPNVSFTYTANSGTAQTRTCTQTEDNHTMQCVTNIRPLINTFVSINVILPNSGDVYITVQEL